MSNEAIKPSVDIVLSNLGATNHGNHVSGHSNQNVADSGAAKTPKQSHAVHCQFHVLASASHVPFVAALGAWALVWGRLAESDQVEFRARLPGGDLVLGSESMPRLDGSIVDVTFQLSVDGEQGAVDFLRIIHQQLVSGSGLADVDAGFGTAEQTKVMIRPKSNEQQQKEHGTWHNRNGSPSSFAMDVYLGADCLGKTRHSQPREILEKLPPILQSVIHQLQDAEPEMPLRDIQLMTAHDLAALWAWNHRVPEVVHRCLDDIIRERVEAQPHQPAVSAWDGTLTYQQLDQLATRLSAHLVTLGVGPEVLVPICCEKSMWATVAILGIIKAGGGFVLLDPSLPEQRLRNMVHQAEATVILSSVPCRSLSYRLVPGGTITVDWNYFNSEPVGCLAVGSSPNSDSSSSRVLYAVFTSGSTGSPKGVKITHTNFASALHHQARFMALNPQSKVFDFASYSFDVSISNVLFTLAAGACLCVPNSEDRVSCLEASIVSSHANVLDITPSAARLLSPERIPEVKTIIFSGEPLRTADVDRWWAKVSVIHAYGPTECTPTSTFNCNASDREEATHIGKGAGLVPWIVDAQNHEQLLPLGWVGELLLEGPLVSDGYFGHNKDKTAHVFIKDPVWLLQGVRGQHHGRHGRLYKTGDLVRYTEHGSLIFVGRKDSQVKIRGQRVELAEVEHVIQRCLPLLPHAGSVVVECVSAEDGDEGSSPVLTVFLLQHYGGRCSDETAATVIAISSELESKLVEALPGYMVPTLFISMPVLPTTDAGKTDRRQLRQVARSLLSRPSKCEPSRRKPRSEVEKRLQGIWSKVLNINPARIGLDDSFVRLGGDSISAMQASSMAQAAHINVRFNDMLSRKTIGRLVEGLMPTNVATHVHQKDLEAGDGPLELSPIQRLYVHLQQPNPNICFDLFFFLKIRATTPVSPLSLSEALETIVRRHDILRTRWAKSSQDTWTPHLPSRCDGAATLFHMQRVAHPGQTAETASHIRLCRARLNIEQGPLLAGVFFDNAGRGAQTLFLTIHHFVVDLVSWREILRELEELLLGDHGTNVLFPPPPSSMSFHSWVRLQARYASANLDAPDVSSTPKPMLAYWGMQHSDNVERGVVTTRRIMSETASGLVLDACRQNGIRLVDMMIAALLHSFSLVFHDRALPAVFSEGHGREPWADSIDVSTSVGWFTTFWPVRVPEPNEGLPKRTALDTFRHTMNCVRGLRQNGWAWFTSQFISKSSHEAMPSDFPAEILFNFEGRYQQLERSDGLFEQLELPDGCTPASAGDIKRFALFEIAARVDKGSIATVWNYHEHMKRRRSILFWATSFKDVLTELASELLAAPPGWLRQEGDATQRVTDIPRTSKYPVVEQSFAQERLWFLEQLYPGLPWFLMPFAVRIRGCLRLDALQAALSALEKRHETLRTTFASVEGVNMQRIHAWQPGKPRLRVVDMSSHEEHDLMRELRKDQALPIRLQDEPGWRVTVFQRDVNECVLSIVIHHIVYDGWSFGVLTRELAALYSTALHGPNATSSSAQLETLPIQYRDYSAWERQQAQSEEHQKQLEYWVEQLRDSHPAELLCDKPRPATLTGAADMQQVRIEGELYDRLQRLCRVSEMTPFVVLLAVFRAAHYRLTGVYDAAIGVANANRSRWELQDMIGFFVNLQCIRITIDDSTSFQDTIDQVQTLMMKAFANQDVPFDRIVSELRPERHLSRHPLVQMVFAVHSQRDFGDFVFEGAEVEQIAWQVTSRFDVEFHIYPEEGAFRGEVLFSTELYEPATIRSLLSVFCELLNQAIREPNAPVACLPLMTGPGYKSLHDLTQVLRTDYPRHSSIVHIFRQQAMACPDRIAVKDASEQLTYAQLNQRSESLSWWLARRGLPAETLVAVLANRSCATVVAFLGILKANLAYLPLDTRAPAGRTAQILECIPTLGSGSRKLVMVGSDVQVPDELLSPDCEFVPLVKETVETEPYASSSSMPSAHSLAYVMFTSGSTGRPKGVMVEHRSILRLVLQSNNVEYLPKKPVTAHMANLAFDMSTTEIYATLLHGGTLVCIGQDVLLNHLTLPGVFCQEKIEMLILTPTLLRQYLSACPTVLCRLRLLQVGGERVDLADLLMARTLVKGIIQNAYGPTENTGASTVYTLPQHDEKGVASLPRVPIGRPLSNSGAHIMDKQQNLVPLGVVGELIVTGDGLARGYINVSQNTHRFVHIVINGEVVRAYRTGDLARHRLTDGQIEFLGRMDSGQVKIRGQRVELGEIDHALRNQHDRVKDAVTLILGPTTGEESSEELASFVTVHKERHQAVPLDEAASRSLVETWTGHFDGNAYSRMRHLSPEEIGRDFVGWTSMIHGGDIEKSEMSEWLDDTMETILNGGTAGRVLEIGTGSGMILFNLMTRGLESYVGLEASIQAVDFVTRTVASMPILANKVQMHHITAAEVDTLGRDMSPSLVVLNSVVQYFPSLDYLFMVIRKILLQMTRVRTVVLGDIRSYASYREFLAAKALQVAGGQDTKMGDVRRIMADLARAESELLVDATFFTSLPGRLPGRIEHVEILPKKMEAKNELSQFRYAVVLHIRDGDDMARRPVRDVADAEWISFAEQQLDGDALSRLLAAKRPVGKVVAVSNISSAGLVFERHLVDALDKDVGGQVERDTRWLSRVRQECQRMPSLSPWQISQLAERAGYRAEISWARQFSQRGGYDVIFHKENRDDKPTGQTRSMFRFPVDHADQQHPPRQLSSEPLRQQAQSKGTIEAELKAVLAAQLPCYMVPQKIVVLDQLPVNANGKIDHLALQHAARRRADDGSRRLVQQPKSKAGLALQAVWARALSMEPRSIGLQDNFFSLGGNSIVAMKVASEALKTGFGFTVADVFRYPVLGDLVGHADCDSITDEQECPPFSLLGNKVHLTSLLDHVSTQCGLEAAAVQDIYPCLPLQEELLAWTGRKPGTNMLQLMLEITPSMLVEGVCAAWEQVAKTMPILRTRLVQHDQLGPLQVVVDQKIQWLRGMGRDQYLQHDREMSMKHGQPLTRFALVAENGSKRPKWLVWTAHHALYDGWSFPMIFSAVERAYRGEALRPAGPRFESLIKYVQDRDDKDQVARYWRETLADCPFNAFPIVPPSSIRAPPRADKMIEHSFPAPERQAEDVTMATLIRAAWGILSARMLQSDDVVYGATVSGRGIPFAGIDDLAAPMCARVPIRVRLSSKQRVRQYLLATQQQAIDMMPYEQAGLERIAKIARGDENAPLFQTLLIIQPAEEQREGVLGPWEVPEQYQWFCNFVLKVHAQLGPGLLSFQAFLDTNIIGVDVVAGLLRQMEVVMRELACAGVETTIGDFSKTLDGKCK